MEEGPSKRRVHSLNLLDHTLFFYADANSDLRKLRDVVSRTCGVSYARLSLLTVVWTTLSESLRTSVVKKLTCEIDRRSGRRKDGNLVQRIVCFLQMSWRNSEATRTERGRWKSLWRLMLREGQTRHQTPSVVSLGRKVLDDSIRDHPDTSLVCQRGCAEDSIDGESVCSEFRAAMLLSFFSSFERLSLKLLALHTVA